MLNSFFSKSSKHIGLPPGTLVHIGKKKTAEVKITGIKYNRLQFFEKTVNKIEEKIPLKGRPSVTWINVNGIHKAEIIENIGEYFDLHPLILEDIMNTEQRPKIEDFEDYIFIVLKLLYYDEKSDEMKVEQISLILLQNFVISFQESPEDIFNPIKERIRSNKGRIRKMSADFLAYALIDVIVDNYFQILEKIGERIEDIEEELVENPVPGTVQAIHNLKREMILLRKSVWPLREIVNHLQREDSKLIKGSTLAYLRDVYDHTIQVIDTIESFRDMLGGMLDLYLSVVSNRMNEIMKVLTIIATIFIPLTFIAGIYGMNFVNMPELEWRFGYPIILLIMIIMSISMLFYFRIKKWL
jgi:magnesium transporter